MAPPRPLSAPERAALTEDAVPALRATEAVEAGERLEDAEGVDVEVLFAEGLDEPAEPAEEDADDAPADDVAADTPATDDGTAAGCPDVVKLGAAGLSEADVSPMGALLLALPGPASLAALPADVKPDDAVGPIDARVAAAVLVCLAGVEERSACAVVPVEDGRVPDEAVPTDRGAPADPAARIGDGIGEDGEAGEPVALGEARPALAEPSPAVLAAPAEDAVVTPMSEDDGLAEEDGLTELVLEGSDLAAVSGAEEEYFTSVRPLDEPAESPEAGAFAAAVAVDRAPTAPLSSVGPVISLPIVFVLSPSVTVSIFSALRSRVWPCVLFGLDRLGRLVIASAPFLPAAREYPAQGTVEGCAPRARHPYSSFIRAGRASFKQSNEPSRLAEPFEKRDHRRIARNQRPIAPGRRQCRRDAA